jgi:hypothetical protein
MIFLIIDYIASSYLINSSKKIFNKEKYGFYNLSKSYEGYEVFGSSVYKVFTDKNGFRSASNVNVSIKYKMMFLGDSAVYGMMKWEDSMPGIFQKISNIDILNGGVPSYSPTTYLNRYKEALKYDLLNENHIIIIGLDISDVQDEAGYWMDPSHMNLYDVDHPINLMAFKKVENKLNPTTDIGTIKDWVIAHLKTTTILYRIIKFNVVEENDYLKPFFYSSRSAFTWQDFNQLEKSEAIEGDNYSKGYLPLGVEGGLKKIKIKISEINKLVHQNNGKGIYLLVYPWPAQIHHKDKFKWSDYVNELCLEINCLGTVDLMKDLRNYAETSDDWYTKFFLNGDIHLNKYGNKIFAEKIWKEIKN